MARTDTIQPGYCVAVHLLPDSAPESCYIGVVEAVDDHGIMINLVHWDEKLDNNLGCNIRINTHGQYREIRNGTTRKHIQHIDQTTCCTTSLC